MQNNSIYKSIETAKNGTLIPVLQNGRTIESRYNPQNEAQKFIENISENDKFIILIGVAGGAVLEAILNKNPDAFIIGVENSQSDIDFLKGIELVKKLSEKQGLILTGKENLSSLFIQNYFPVFHGNIKILEQKSWCNENPEAAVGIRGIIQDSLKIIFQDYSVQSHFGKIWQDNIIKNLIQSRELKIPEDKIKKIDNSKTALVVAAGPSLDKKIKDIQNERSSLYIISTDTAYSILYKNGIIPDAVISIDGQAVSRSHFMAHKDLSSTLFIFDLTSNNSAVNYVKEKNGSIIFSYNNHPFSNYAAQYFKDNFIYLYTGSGTVTIAALDFARIAGFNKIKIYGADFSYLEGKPYAKSTYLDSIYSGNASRLLSTEKQFSHLMFRTPLIKINDSRFTTDVLVSYKNSLEDYLKSTGSQYSTKDDYYEILVKENERESINILSKIKTSTLDFKSFILDFTKNYDEHRVVNSMKELNQCDICLLPLMSQLKMNENINNESFSSLLNIAYKTLLRYN